MNETPKQQKRAFARCQLTQLCFPHIPESALTNINYYLWICTHFKTIFILYIFTLHSYTLRAPFLKMY